MKKHILFILILFALISCKKQKFSPEGPSDIRIRNLTDYTFTEVSVSVSGETINFIDIEAKSVSEYHRFKKSFPKADISVKVNDETFSTEPVDYTYMQYFGQDKVTYEVIIEDFGNKKLKISNVILEGPIDP